MKAYAELLATVAQSIDDFAADNVTPNAGRDRLAEDTCKAAHDLALSMSNRGYGAAHVAAARLATQVRQALALLTDAEVAAAFGARSMHELVAKQAGMSTSEVKKLERRADAGASLLGALADNAALLATPSKSPEVARRLAGEASAARTWLTERPTPVAMSPKKVRLLCFDKARRLAPCRVERR